MIAGPRNQSCDTNASVALIERRFCFLLIEIIPVGSDYILSYDIAIRNAEQKARTACRIATKYSGPLVRGSGVLIVGSWLDWYDGEGANWYFDLPEDPAFKHRFFSFPDPEAFWPLDWVRVRVLCQM